MLEQFQTVTMGSDPEHFFTQDGRVVGAEKVLPANGVLYNTSSSFPNNVVLDGVQVELHPAPHNCRQIAGMFLQECFKSIHARLKQLEATGQKFEVCFNGVVEVDPLELASLKPESRQFGCQPSLNIYGKGANETPSGEKYLVRAGGGHIHIGNLPLIIYYNKMQHGEWAAPGQAECDYRRRLVPLFDALVGNTCVLIDRDPKQVERRKYYGRAGEYREQPHGIEYRTLSNFWMRSYPLYSFVLGMSRMAIDILRDTLKGKQDYEGELLSKIDFDKMIEAINTNNAVLARENFEVVRRFIQLNTNNSQSYPLVPSLLPKFDLFLEDVAHRGIEKIWPGDPFMGWINQTVGWTVVPGWERWLGGNY